MEQQMQSVGIAILCGSFGALLSMAMLIGWQYYLKLRHDYLYTVIYRIALASVAHFGSGAAHGVRVEWAVSESRRVLGPLAPGLIENYVKSSLASIVPYETTDDDEEVEEMFGW